MYLNLDRDVLDERALDYTITFLPQAASIDADLIEKPVKRRRKGVIRATTPKRSKKVGKKRAAKSSGSVVCRSCRQKFT